MDKINANVPCPSHVSPGATTAGWEVFKTSNLQGANGATFWHSPWPGWRKWMNNIWKIWENQLLFKACFVCSFCFILWCSTFKCTSSKTLDSRLSTGLPGRKRGFCLHLCPDWMLVGSWFEVFKCYSCSWEAETWSGSSVLLSNFSLSTQFGKNWSPWHHPPSWVLWLSWQSWPLRSPWICGTGWKSSTKMPLIGTTPLVAWQFDRWIKTPANAPLVCHGRRWRVGIGTKTWRLGNWFSFSTGWLWGSFFSFSGVVVDVTDCTSVETLKLLGAWLPDSLGPVIVRDNPAWFSGEVSSLRWCGNKNTLMVSVALSRHFWFEGIQILWTCAGWFNQFILKFSARLIQWWDDVLPLQDLLKSL